MNPKYARYINNPHARAEVVAEGERIAAGKPKVAKKAPKSVAKLNLTETSREGLWEGPCPACRAEGHDNKGNHLFVFSNGAFGCLLHQGEDGKEHRAEMVRLCPALGGGEGKNWKPKPKDLTAEKQAVEEASKKLWETVKTAYSGGLATLGESAPIPDEPREHFLAWCRLWLPGEVAWCGDRYDSNEAFLAHRFEPAGPLQCENMWDKIVREGLDHARGLNWQPTATSRSLGNWRPWGDANEQVAGMRLFVVERDHSTLEECVALWRFCQEALALRLRMVVSSGGGGWHALFDPPHKSRMQDVTKILSRLGADPNALAGSCTRIPGARRVATDKKPGGGFQGLVWINPNPTQK